MSRNVVRLWSLVLLATSLGMLDLTRPLSTKAANVILVSTTIQAAVDAAQPGDTVRVPPGTYPENVTVRKNNITIQGSVGAVMDGLGLAGPTGITVTPAAPATTVVGFNLLSLEVRNYKDTGVLLNRVQGFLISGGKYLNNDQYGIFPIQSSAGSITLNEVSGSNDTGIYVGQSANITVTENHSHNCTVGIEVENSSGVSVWENTVVENSVGVLVNVLPGLAVTATSNVSVADNVLIRNNRPNPSTNPSDVLTLLPSGIGMLNLGGDRVAITKNIVIQNKSAGIAVAQLPPAVAALDPRIDPIPDNNEIRDNVALGNGANPDPKLAPFPGSDLLWDLSGTGNCWAGNVFNTSFPKPLPACP